jgi:ArsR family transcriptional regulator
MLQAEIQRLAGLANVELRTGDLESLPLDDAEVDAATLILVLHHATEPRRVLAEAARVVKPGGRLLVIDMLPHEAHEYPLDTGHVWLGFSPAQMERLTASAGLGGSSIRTLPVDPQAKGPVLFAARIDVPEENESAASSENEGGTRA